MATIINTPPHHNGDEGMGVGMMVGILLTALVLLTLFYFYGWPVIRDYNNPPPQEETNINVFPQNENSPQY